MNTCSRCGTYTRCRNAGFKWYYYIIFFWEITGDTDISSSWICKKCEDYERLLKKQRLEMERRAHKEFIENEEKKMQIEQQKYKEQRDKLLKEAGK